MTVVALTRAFTGRRSARSARIAGSEQQVTIQLPTETCAGSRSSLAEELEQIGRQVPVDEQPFRRPVWSEDDGQVVAGS